MNDLNQNMVEHIKQMLQVPVAGVATSEENVVNQGQVNLFLIGGITRSFLYRYALISSAGNVSFHAMSPFTFIDDNQKPQYRKKTVWASVNMDSQPNADRTVHYNNNFGAFLTLLKPEINGKANIFNSLNLHAPRIKQAIVPADIDPKYVSLLNAPAIKLQEAIQENSQHQIEAKDLVKLNIQAYQEYTEEVLQLVMEQKLTYAFALINPKPNSVSFSLQFEDTLNAASNPWLNASKVFNTKLPISHVPTLNQYNAVVQVVETDDLDIVFSDTNEMLGTRVVFNDTEANRKLEAITKLAVIKDYGHDTYVLLSIVDPNNTMADKQTRTQAFQKLLDKGINTFSVRGALAPVVRLKDTNAARFGNVLFELRIEDYSVYQSSNIRNSIDTDAFGDLDLTTTEGDFDIASSFAAEPVQNVDLEANKPSSSSDILDEFAD